MNGMCLVIFYLFNGLFWKISHPVLELVDHQDSTRLLICWCINFGILPLYGSALSSLL